MTKPWRDTRLSGFPALTRERIWNRCITPVLQKVRYGSFGDHAYLHDPLVIVDRLSPFKTYATRGMQLRKAIVRTDDDIMLRRVWFTIQPLGLLAFHVHSGMSINFTLSQARLFQSLQTIRIDWYSEAKFISSFDHDHATDLGQEAVSMAAPHPVNAVVIGCWTQGRTFLFRADFDGEDTTDFEEFVPVTRAWPTEARVDENPW